MKKWIFIGTLALVIGLSFFLWKVIETEKKEQAIEDAWEKERRPYEVKRKKLEQELDVLVKEYENLKKPKGTTQFFFAELDSKVYTECYPLMKKKGYTGTLVLSLSQLPGNDGCMTVEQFQELINEGWDTCIQWETQQSVSMWLPTLQTKLDKLKIEKSNKVYFPKGSYDVALDETIRKKGFSIVVCEKDDYESPLQNQDEAGIWHVGAMGIMTAKPKTWLQEAATKASNVVFLIGFQKEHQLYNLGTFERMLQAVQEYVTSGDMLGCDLVSAREYYKTRHEGLSQEIEEAYQQERAKLETEIQEVKEQLKKIDAKYQ